MSDVAIAAEGLGKRYHIGMGPAEPYGNLRESMMRALGFPLRRLRGTDRAEGATREVWALKDVSFEVKHGEAVGIIGCNGAGKSTLLKLLSRITAPTAGRAVVHGRVGSLLEVGTGFHPELTGRENIYLNGAVMGMSRADIKRRFDGIVDFSGVETYLDTPVKRYSSGMYMRLAFAVAAHLEPEILVVDEVLAVGDAAFQKKCMGKMSDVANEGRTVLFVSHNLAAIQSLCHRVTWLQKGQVKGEGLPNDVIARYLTTALAVSTEHVWPDIATAVGNDRVRLHRVSVRPQSGAPSDPITIRTPLQMEFEYWNLRPNTYLNLSLHVYNEQGVMAFNAIPLQEPAWHGRPFPAGLFRSVCRVPGDLLNDGMHRVELLVVQDQGKVIYHHDDILLFDVQDDHTTRGDWYGRWPGAVRPKTDWTTELISPLAAPSIGAASDEQRDALVLSGRIA